MIPKECKRLAEVDFPIAIVSKSAVREKAGPKGHPSTLHLWWARRPLAACRSMLIALLLPDPCDSFCPADFKVRARAILPDLTGEVGPEDLDLRRALLRFIGSFADWDHSNLPQYVDIARALIKAAHPGEAPLVVDPFAGGGSIPLEAQRIGCESFASDLNPVAYLILKVMLEDIPCNGLELANALDYVGKEIKSQANEELERYYPKDQDGATPIAYLWARTVRCESPNCGAEIPVYKSPWLSKKGATKARFFRESTTGQCVALLVQGSPLSGPITFKIARGEGSENPRQGFEEIIGTKAKGNNASVICPCCGNLLPGKKQNPRTAVQLVAQRGGADVIFDSQGHRTGGATLLAVVSTKTGEVGRRYRLSTDQDYSAVYNAQLRVKQILIEWEKNPTQSICPVPDESTPIGGGSGAGRAFSVYRYGMTRWGDLFTARQKVALMVLVDCIRRSDSRSVRALALALSRTAMCGTSLTKWNAYAEKMQHVYGMQALPMIWDFAEVAPLAKCPGSWLSACDLASNVVRKSIGGFGAGQSVIADATESPLPDSSCAVWFTDPPYYDAIPYADLADLFYVWLKRLGSISEQIKDPFDSTNSLTPKSREIVQDELKEFESKPKDRKFFELRMERAFAEGKRVVREDGISCVVFAHKTTEGWEALLTGIVSAGLTITSSWPIATEGATRLRARDSAALATSVHLVCRPRLQDAGVGDWGRVLKELPPRVGDWMDRLQQEGIRGADLVFACIGPALEIFSRYSRVETADGSEVKLAEYLEKVWEVVGRLALEQVLGTDEAMARNGVAGALEEDARLTTLFLWTLQSTSGKNGAEADGELGEDDDVDDDDEDSIPKSKSKGFSLIFDVVKRFAQPLGIDLEKWENRVITTDKGVVRLLPVSERAKQLFGEDGARAVADWIENDPVKNLQQVLFPEEQIAQAPRIRGRAGRGIELDPSALEADHKHQATTLDRVHAAMLLQAGGQTNALRALLKAEQDRGPDFLRLSNALTALYPTGSEEKRLLDAMLLAVPR